MNPPFLQLDLIFAFGTWSESFISGAASNAASEVFTEYVIVLRTSGGTSRKLGSAWHVLCALDTQTTTRGTESHLNKQTKKNMRHVMHHQILGCNVPPFCKVQCVQCFACLHTLSTQCTLSSILMFMIEGLALSFMHIYTCNMAVMASNVRQTLPQP